MLVSRLTYQRQATRARPLRHPPSRPKAHTTPVPEPETNTCSHGRGPRWVDHPFTWHPSPGACVASRWPRPTASRRPATSAPTETHRTRSTTTAPPPPDHVTIMVAPTPKQQASAGHGQTAPGRQAAGRGATRAAPRQVTLGLGRPKRSCDAGHHQPARHCPAQMQLAPR